MTENEREHLLSTVGQVHAGLSVVALKLRLGLPPKTPVLKTAIKAERTWQVRNVRCVVPRRFLNNDGILHVRHRRDQSGWPPQSPPPRDVRTVTASRNH